MSLRIKFSKDTLVVKTGYGFKMGYSPPFEEFPLEVYYQDMMLHLTRTGDFFCPSFVRTIADVYGFEELPGFVETLVVSQPVRLVPPDRLYEVDLPYRNFSYGLQIFLATLGGRTYRTSTPSYEKPCRHFTYSGELITKTSDLPMQFVDYDFHGLVVKVRQTVDRLVSQNITVNSVVPFGVTSYAYDYGGFYSLNFIDLISSLLGKEVISLSTISGQLTRRVFSGLSFDHSSAGLTISYHMQSDNLVTGKSMTWTSEMNIPFGMPVSIGSPIVGGLYSTTYTGGTVFSYRDGTSTPPAGGRYSDSQVGTGSVQAFPVLLSDPSTNDPGGYDRAHDVHDSLSDNRFLRSFEESVRKDFYDISSSAVFSTVDAFKKAEASLDTDVLQNIAKLPDIADALPKIKEAIDLLGRLARRDLGFATLRDILDLSTSTVLQANFEWRPYMDLITRYLPQMLSTLKQLGVINSNSASRGSFRFKLNNQLGRKEVTLLTRTKIVMDTSLSGLLSATLGLDALGIIPKPSNLWDLIPFTFAVNWFTGIGANIRRGEYTILLATLPAYYVHSYTLSSPLSQDELDLLKMSNSLEEPAALRVYIRDVTLYTPFLRDSKFGFGIPTGLPPLGTVGSLLYQLLFSR